MDRFSDECGKLNACIIDELEPRSKIHSFRYAILVDARIGPKISIHHLVLENCIKLYSTIHSFSAFSRQQHRRHTVVCSLKNSLHPGFIFIWTCYPVQAQTPYIIHNTQCKLHSPIKYDTTYICLCTSNNKFIPITPYGMAWLAHDFGYVRRRRQKNEKQRAMTLRLHFSSSKVAIVDIFQCHFWLISLVQMKSGKFPVIGKNVQMRCGENVRIHRWTEPNKCQLKTQVKEYAIAWDWKHKMMVS